jgi:hypothetical protein
MANELFTPVEISDEESLQAAIELVNDADGSPVDITAPGFGTFRLLLRRTDAQLDFPSSGLVLAPRDGSTNILDWSATLAKLNEVALPGLRFSGELVRTVPGDPVVHETWAAFSFIRKAVGQSVSSYGPTAITIRRTTTKTVLVRVGPLGNRGAAGFTGWSPLFAAVSDGARRVMQIADWVGGQGTKPATGGYIGAAGVVALIADAVDFRGAIGLRGWSPVFSLIADGARRVLQLTDWTGGEGSKPAVGEFVGVSGLVATAAEAVDIRGAAGPMPTVPGVSGQVLFNNGGAFAADAGLTFDPATNALTITGGPLVLAGDQSAPAWTTNGIRFRGVPATLTDTTSAGTVPAAYTNVYGGNTIAANSAVTFTDYFTTFINPPNAGANVTIPNRWALGLGGDLRVNGRVRIGDGFLIDQGFGQISVGGSAANPFAYLSLNFIQTTGQLGFALGPVLGGPDTSIGRRAAANIRIGSLDAAAPISQTISFQSVAAGTANTAAPNAFIDLPQGTGLGAGGALIFRAAPAGSSGSAQNALQNVLSINADRSVTIGDNFGNAGRLNIGVGLLPGRFFGNSGSLGAWADGVLTMRDNAGASFDRLQFGGTDTNFPALKRSGAALQARLADDSAFANFKAALVIAGTGLCLDTDAGTLAFGASLDAIIRRRAANNISLGPADAAAPVAQSLSMQSVVAGTANTAGAALIIEGSRGTGSAPGGEITFRTAPAGSAGSAQNALIDVLRINALRQLVLTGGLIVDNYTSGSQITLRNNLGPITSIHAVGSDGRQATLAFNSSVVQFPNTRVEAQIDGASDMFRATNGNGTSIWFVLASDGVADVLAQRRGTNPQEQRTYGTFTNVSNYRRVSVGMSAAGVGFLRPEGAGTGGSGNVIHISGLPTSNPGPGILWNNSGNVVVGT